MKRTEYKDILLKGRCLQMVVFNDPNRLYVQRFDRHIYGSVAGFFPKDEAGLIGAWNIKWKKTR